MTVIVHDYIYTIGGAEKVLENLVEIYPNAHIYTSFITPKTHSSPILDSVLKSGHLHYSRALTNFTKIFSYSQLSLKIARILSFFYFYFLRISGTIGDNNFAIVNNVAGFSVYTNFKNFSKEIYYIHKILSFSFFEDRNWIQKTLHYFYSKQINKLRGKIFANSVYSKGEFLRVFGFDDSDVDYIYPAVKIPEYSFSVEELSKLQNDKYLLFIGRLEKSKGILEIVQYCVENNVKLKVIGEGSLRNLLPISPSVEYLGFVSESDKYRYLAGARAFITAGGLREEFGMTALEAISVNTPVIAVSAGGVTEIVREYQGCLIPDLSTENISSALAYTDKLDRKHINLDNNGNKYLDKYSFEKFRENILQKFISKS